MIERGIAALFFAAFLIVLFAGKGRSAGRFSKTKYGRFAEPIFHPRYSMRTLFWIALPLLPLVVHNILYSVSAYESLFLGDFDFTNISDAILETAKGNGLLHSRFVPTGANGNFFGHHFAPALLLYVPFYFAALHVDPVVFRLFHLHMTHFLYAVCLSLTFLPGLVFWSRYAVERLRHPALALLALAGLSVSPFFFRLPGSFHFELLVLPLSALVFLQEQKRGASFWIYLFLWMGIKEDMAVYVAFYGLYLFFNFRTSHRGLAVMIVATFYYFLATGPLQAAFAGPGSVDFGGYFEDRWHYVRSMKPFFNFMFAFAFLPLLSLRIFVFTILPIFIIHAFSYHPWHASFYGHYVYGVLPFMIRAYLDGSDRIHRVSVQLKDSPNLRYGLLVFSVLFYTASSDKETPQPVFHTDPRYQTIGSLMQSLPGDGCIRTQIPFTPHVPLTLSVYPLIVPEGNPLRTHDRYAPPCDRYSLLIDISDPRPPYYTADDLAAFLRNAERNLAPVFRKGPLRLFLSRPATNRSGMRNGPE